MYEFLRSVKSSLKENFNFNLDMYINEIYELLNNDCNQKALDTIKICYEKGHAVPLVFALEAVALARLGFFEQSLEICNKLLDIDITAKDYNIFHCLVNALLVLGKYSNIEALCLEALKHDNSSLNRDEYLKILLNTYVRMLKFDLARDAALKIYSKNKNQSFGVLYCLFAILKDNTDNSSIQVARMFMKKLNFSEFKPEIKFFLELSLMLASQNYDEIIDYFKCNEVICSEMDYLELLLYVYIKKKDFISALQLLKNSSLKSLNLSLLELDLCIVTKSDFDSAGDDLLQLEFTKRSVLYKYLLDYKKIPDSPSDLWNGNSGQLNEYIHLLKTALAGKRDKSFFFKFASNYLPVLPDFCTPVNNASCSIFPNPDDCSLMEIINYEKIKIQSKYYDTASVELLYDKINSLIIKAEHEIRMELAMLIIEFYFLLYYKTNCDLLIICKLLSFVEKHCCNLKINLLHNVLIDVYGFLGLDDSYAYYNKLKFNESQVSSQAPRFLHYALTMLKQDYVTSLCKNYMQWHNSTRCYMSNSLVFATERRPNLLPHLAKLYHLHTHSALKCFHASAQLMQLIDSDVDNLLNQSKLYIDEYESFINGKFNWFFRNTTASFDHTVMPSFQYVCLQSIPFPLLMDEIDLCAANAANFANHANPANVNNANNRGEKSPFFPNDSAFFSEPHFAFPHKFYRSFANCTTKAEILRNSKFFPGQAQIQLHSPSWLYKFNLQTHKFIELETEIFVSTILLINYLSNSSNVERIISSIKENIASYTSHLDGPQMKWIPSLTNKILDIITVLAGSDGQDVSESLIRSINESIKCIIKSISEEKVEINVNSVVNITKFFAAISMFPGKLLLVLKWMLKRRDMDVDSLHACIKESNEQVKGYIKSVESLRTCIKELNEQVKGYIKSVESMILCEGDGNRLDGECMDINRIELRVCKSNLSILTDFCIIF